MKRRIYLVLAIVTGIIYIILSALYPHLELVMWFRSILFVAFIFFVLYTFSDGKSEGK